MDPTATLCWTFSHVQLDPIPDHFSLEDAEALRSQRRWEFQGMIQSSQEQIRVDMTHLMNVRMDHCMLSRTWLRNKTFVMQLQRRRQPVQVLHLDIQKATW